MSRSSVAAGAGRLCAPTAPAERFWAVPQLFAVRRQTVRRVIGLALLLLAAAASAKAQDDPGLGVHETCKSAIDNEIVRGSKMKDPVSNPLMKDFYGNVIFYGTFNDRPAMIVYVCTGTKASGGWVGSRLIYIEGRNEGEVQREFARERGLLQARLGLPCRAASDGHQHVAWKRTSGIFTFLDWAKWHVGPNWNVIIQTFQPDNPSATVCSSE